MNNEKNTNDLFQKFSGMVTLAEEFAKTLEATNQRINQWQASGYMEQVKKALLILVNLSDELQEYDYNQCKEMLNRFYWTWPYNISEPELKCLIEKSKGEEDFDKFMLSFFTKEKIKNMIEKIKILLPEKQKMLFGQIIMAYDNKLYAIGNIAIMSIIDNELAIVLHNKGNVHRKGILEPVVNFYIDKSGELCIGQEIIIRLVLLANVIDFIYQNYNFDEKIKINTNKSIRRHLAMHGEGYSNKSIDFIMLLNTLYELEEYYQYLKVFESSIREEKKKFIYKDTEMLLEKAKKMLTNRSC